MDETEAVAAAMRRLIDEHSTLIAGDIWHPVEARWASHWAAHIRLNAKADDARAYSSPGPVDNSRLQGIFFSIFEVSLNKPRVAFISCINLCQLQKMLTHFV